MTQSYVTGTSIFGVKFKGGVLLAADKALSYGKMHLDNNFCRISQMTDKCAVVFSGDEADRREALEVVEQQVKHARCNGLEQPSAKSVHGSLALQNYEKRNDGEPYVNGFLVAGPKFLGYLDLFGTTLELPFFATSLGRAYCMPLMRRLWNEDITKDQAHQLIRECIKVMVNNDCLACQNYDVWFVTEQGIEKVSGKSKDNFEIANHSDLRLFI